MSVTASKKLKRKVRRKLTLPFSGKYRNSTSTAYRFIYIILYMSGNKSIHVTFHLRKCHRLLDLRSYDGYIQFFSPIRMTYLF